MIVLDLPPNVFEGTLYRVFRTYGEVLDVVLQAAGGVGAFAFGASATVTFASRLDAAMALEALNGVYRIRQDAEPMVVRWPLPSADPQEQPRAALCPSCWQHVTWAAADLRVRCSHLIHVNCFDEWASASQPGCGVCGRAYDLSAARDDRPPFPKAGPADGGRPKGPVPTKAPPHPASGAVPPWAKAPPPSAPAADTQQPGTAASPPKKAPPGYKASPAPPSGVPDDYPGQPVFKAAPGTKAMPKQPPPGMPKESPPFPGGGPFPGPQQHKAPPPFKAAPPPYKAAPAGAGAWAGPSNPTSPPPSNVDPVNRVQTPPPRATAPIPPRVDIHDASGQVEDAEVHLVQRSYAAVVNQRPADRRTWLRAQLRIWHPDRWVGKAKLATAHVITSWLNCQMARLN